MNGSNITLLEDWRAEDPAGWLLSQKYDGIRAVWSSGSLWTRDGNQIPAPAWFTAGLPAGVHLDGELWAGRGQLETARLAAQWGKFAPGIAFMVFDCPTAPGTWIERMAAAQWAILDAPHADMVSVSPCDGLDDLSDQYFRLLAAGAEGVILRHPSATGYRPGRSRNALRIKPGIAHEHLLYERAEVSA